MIAVINQTASGIYFISKQIMCNCIGAYSYAFSLSGRVGTISAVICLESVLGYVSTLCLIQDCIIERVCLAEYPYRLLASLCNSVRS